MQIGGSSERVDKVEVGLKHTNVFSWLQWCSLLLHLRISILLDLGQLTGDRLPQDLIKAGAFEESETNNVVYGIIAGIRVTETVQGHL